MTSKGALPTRILGRTGLVVTALGYGAMALDQERMAPRGLFVADDDAGAVLNAALDAGINFIDTAPDYGSSEELIGRYIAGRRDEFVLASKAGCAVDVPAGTRGHVYTPANIRAGVERSLQRMKTDHLEIVQFHGSPAPEEEDEAIATLLALKGEGKLRFIGVSSTLPQLAHHVELGVFDVFQIPYSLLQREHEEVIANAAAAGGGTVIRGGVARGAPADDKGWEPRVPEALPQAPKDLWEAASLDDLLDGASRMEFVLRFTLSHPGLHTTIVGTGKLAHLQDNVAAAQKGALPPDVYAEAKRRLDAAGTGR